MPIANFEGLPLYSNLIKDPDSKSVLPDDYFYIAKRFKDQWHIIESARHVSAAVTARKIFMRQDHKSNPETTPLDYRIFKKGLNRIITETT
jgi:hypothetical protein